METNTPGIQNDTTQFIDSISIFIESDTLCDSICNTYQQLDERVENHMGDTTTHIAQALPIKHQAINPAANTGVVGLLILSFVFFAFSYRRGAKYLRHLFSSLFKHNARGNMFDETTINENQLKLSLLSLTFITEGIILYYTLLNNLVDKEFLVLPSIIISILLCAVYYILQIVVYKILANIFSDRVLSDTFTESFTTVNLFIGLFLSPMVLAILFIPQATTIALYISFTIYILARLLIIYKGISIFLPHLFGLIYLILYLCTLEIIPFLLIKKAVIFLFKILEFNLIVPWK